MASSWGHSLHKQFHLSHHRHSGRLLPHADTSYVPLALVLFAVGIALTISSQTMLYADTPHPPPQAESVSLTGVMPGEVPRVPAVITSPTSQQRFTTSPVAIVGTCQPKMLIEIYKNDIFAGSTICDNSGKFSIQIDLLIGQNSIKARIYNALNEAGPESAEVIVFYDASPPQDAALAPLNFVGTQFLLLTDAVFRGTFPGQQMTIPVEVVGGTPPYAINIMWGDTENTVVSRDNNLTFRASHVYKRPGTYQLTLQGTDSKGLIAFLRVAAIINGQPPIAPTATTTKNNLSKLLILWPLYASSVAVVMSFWLGEKREKHILAKHGIIIR